MVGIISQRIDHDKLAVVEMVSKLDGGVKMESYKVESDKSPHSIVNV